MCQQRSSTGAAVSRWSSVALAMVLALLAAVARADDEAVGRVEPVVPGIPGDDRTDQRRGGLAAFGLDEARRGGIDTAQATVGQFVQQGLAQVFRQPVAEPDPSADRHHPEGGLLREVTLIALVGAEEVDTGRYVSTQEVLVGETEVDLR